MLVILIQHLRNGCDQNKLVKGAKKATIRQEGDMGNQEDGIIQTWSLAAKFGHMHKEMAEGRWGLGGCATTVRDLTPRMP